MSRSVNDKRVQRTRKALVGAFNGLLFERGYPAVNVGAVVERAQVGRSTFYDHFRGKEALLASSISTPFNILAEAVGPRDNTVELGALLDHFWAQRALAREVFTGATGRKLRAQLVKQVEQQLTRKVARRTPAFLIPVRLVAVQIAEGMLAPLTAWLLGESDCTAQALAIALRRTTQATLVALSIPLRDA